MTTTARLAVGALVVACIAGGGLRPSAFSPAQSQAANKTELQRLLYVGSPGTHTSENDAGVLVFDAANRYRFVKRIRTWDPEPGKEAEEVRGITASVATGLLYVATANRLGAFDLSTDKLVWQGTYDGECCDRMAVSPDGKVLYVPQYKGKRLHWYVIDARTGALIKNLDAPQSIGAHNTIYSLDGSRVFLEGVRSKLVSVVDSATQSIVGTIGPFGDNVRPFTINGRASLIFVNTDNLLGFEVGDVKTGKMIHHVEVQGFSAKFERSIPHGCPSHGIALSTDEREIWLTDGINGYLHVFDATTSPPKQVKSIKTRTPPYWITFSQDGRYVYPSSGDVIDARTKAIVGGLTDEHARPVDSEKIVEISFRGGKAVSAGHQFGVGLVQ